MIIRWLCEKDNKKWLYPVKKCIYCKGPITKQISRKAKVIGITKVNIPSPMHPITPYYVILLEDKYGNKMPKKTMKDYKIGETYELKLATSDDAVIITKIKYDVEEYLKESLKLVYDFTLDSSDKILIKPSIIEPAYAYQAVNTNPKVLDALINYLKEQCINDIVVGEQSMLGNDVMVGAKKSGILDTCKKHKISFIDLSKTEYVEKMLDGFSFMIAKEAIERKIINVPVMKTNSQISISGAMENMVRIVDEKTQKRMFAEDIEKTLPKLIKVLPQFLTIGDATIGLQAQGPTVLGEPAFLNLLFLSKDPVALDTVFAEAFMLKIPNYLKEANFIGAGNNNSKTIEIIGDELEAIKYRFKLPEKDASSHPNIKIIDGKSDPYIFNTTLKMTSKLTGILGHEMHVVIGSNLIKDMFVGKERLVVYGNDAIQKVKELGVEPLAEISEDIDEVEKIMLLKSILENQEKSKITMGDKIKSKIASFGSRIKNSF